LVRILGQKQHWGFPSWEDMAVEKKRRRRGEVFEGKKEEKTSFWSFLLFPSKSTRGIDHVKLLFPT